MVGAYPLPTAPTPARGFGQPPSRLGLAIFTILLFWPLGIPALVFATQVEPRFYAGDVIGARTASDKALTFSILGIIPGVLCLLWLLLGLLAMAYS